MWQGEISICKLIVPIKVVLVKNDYFLYPKFEISANEWVSVLAQFLLKKYGACISHELIVRLIPT